MRKMQRDAMKSLGNSFLSFEERAGGAARNASERREGGDASCGFCLVALVTALGFMFSATANAAPF